ncbi:MAG: hypothetical protein I8H80_02920 [Alphaproteobacteria bacterium]|nr:hypothetical protein [Alphaproteobacteria bacterium]
MTTIPTMDLKKRKSEQPHVVILGAGASLAAFPTGDKNGRLLPLMNNLISTIKLEPIFEKYGIDYNVKNFEALYSDLASNPSNSDLLSEIEDSIRVYFSEMVIPDTPTLYDYLLLSLREKDIIATFNWDPFLAQAYRRNSNFTDRLPKIVFLHGNVAAGICRKDKTLDFMDASNPCWKCQKPYELSNLLYPIKCKDYHTDDFIDDQWKQIQAHIGHAYLMTIFGYSAPETDVEAKSLMHEAWELNSMKDFTSFDIVDIKGKRELSKTWSQFPTRFSSYAKKINDTYLFYHPRRSCEALQMATLQQDPWSDNPHPKFKTLEELHKWISPLIAEEEADMRLSSRGKGI